MATPLYLTNGCCEPAHATPELLDEWNLPYSLDSGGFHPLTAEELAYIGEDTVEVGKSGYVALLGYTGLYDGRKWLMPVIEIAYQGDQNPDAVLPTRDEARSLTSALASELQVILGFAGGYVFQDEGYDRFIMELCLPFSLAYEQGSYEAWKRYLKDNLFASVDPVALTADPPEFGT